MREVLIGSPSVAFAFGVQTLHSSGLSQAARPPAELRRRALRWHRHCYHVGQPCGRWEVFVRGLASQCPTELCISVACGTVFNGTVVLLPRGPIDPGTPKHNSVGKVLRKHSRTQGRNRQGERPCIPWLKPRGFLAHFL